MYRYQSEHALLCLHQVLPDKLSSIWIDAICIDQQNDTEKGSQLKRMHEIYAGAQSVIVWLGPLPAIPNSSALISRFEDVARRVAHSFPGIDGVAFNDRMLELSDGNAAKWENFHLIKEIPSDSWLAVRELAHNGYFRRQWIWQEVIASTADPVVVCGAHVLSSWQALRKASHTLLLFGETILIRAGASEPRPDYATEGMPTVNLPHQLANIRDQYCLHGQPHMLGKFGHLVLWQNRNSYMCWDERDRLYAMVGLCGFRRLEDWDYSRPFKELYVHFWCDVLRRTKDVNYLTYVEDAAARRYRPRMSRDPDGGSYDAELPSWVPDLRAPLEPTSMWAFYGPCEWMNISKGLPERKNIGENEPIHGIVVDEGRGRLKLDGYLLDTIQASAQSPTEILQLIRDILKDPWTEEDPHGGALDAIWYSMTFLTKRDVDASQGITEDMAVKSHSWLLHDRDFAPDCSILEMLEKKKLLEEVQELDTKNLVFPSPGQTYRPLGMHNTAAVAWGMKRLRLFRTREHWIGKGPESLQVGDEVWIIPGAEVGFVLRPLYGPPGDRTRALMGQAYIHGAMGGELCEVLARRGPAEVVLV